MSAAGCIISLCCDLRVMTDFGFIGLNEIAVGFPILKPTLCPLQILANIVGDVQTQRLLLEGTFLSPQEALKMNVVDALVSRESELLTKAQEMIAPWLKHPDEGRVATKKALRSELVEQYRRITNEEEPNLWEGVNSPATIELLGKAISNLSKNKKKLSNL
eukprot:TRINITY_DN3728_c0_g1_i8.p1 TRINITY_DN3728_c0_g1~~TRINITY_DN3728_c0_g1_i8.p1  ORF type:complete len:161 (-),score=46.00 TRINITY_DN3728_c0_g1_i8:34-516(-)